MFYICLGGPTITLGGPIITTKIPAHNDNDNDNDNEIILFGHKKIVKF